MPLKVYTSSDAWAVMLFLHKNAFAKQSVVHEAGLGIVPTIEVEDLSF